MEYDAFTSYRRSDGRRVAEWLRRELERFRPPKKLAYVAAKKLRVYLDTAYERGTDDFYENSIRPALLASRYLIVVATPDALERAPGKTDWMQRERADFANRPNARNVLVARGAGGFPGTLPADLAERFPNIEIVDLRGAGRLSPQAPEREHRRTRNQREHGKPQPGGRPQPCLLPLLLLQPQGGHVLQPHIEEGRE